MLKISETKITDVEHILKTVDRKPLAFITENDYKEYLFDYTTPTFVTDDKVSILEEIKRLTNEWVHIS